MQVYWSQLPALAVHTFPLCSTPHGLPLAHGSAQPVKPICWQACAPGGVIQPCAAHTHAYWPHVPTGCTHMLPTFVAELHGSAPAMVHGLTQLPRLPFSSQVWAPVGE